MKYFSAVFVFFLSISCNSLPDLKDEFNCKILSTNDDLKIHNDVRNMFSTQLPNNWKVNLYYDNTKTSIYAADTTLSLTKTTLIDVTLVHKTAFIDNTFKQKITDDNKRMQLSEVKTNAINLLNKPSYFSYAKGKKNNYTYHILNTFTKINSENFLHIKTEVYGDSLVDKRICNAIKLIDKIQLN
ncbi:hypothetical protein CXF68_10420 [Tenacibaculum sp. Bg11-29]|uniref:hypothetical protein n=1 Tax=Tenacibaculum sp. Bg11-29 TaxID=2058306 RepID=UPI000C31DE1D|nr:hypothetical protein [Tenacibaculum sp. Bg11-29]PKH51073.1 hypothetical protein CXF68_10420 [Tenacibaculum sp. Bg11-29]